MIYFNDHPLINAIPIESRTREWVFFAELKTRLARNESLKESAKVNCRENVHLLYDMLFNAVLQTMIESNFDMFKRINDNNEFAKKVREVIFEQVYREILGSEKE